MAESARRAKGGAPSLSSPRRRRAPATREDLALRRGKGFSSQLERRDSEALEVRLEPLAPLDDGQLNWPCGEAEASHAPARSHRNAFEESTHSSRDAVRWAVLLHGLFHAHHEPNKPWTTDHNLVF